MSTAKQTGYFYGNEVEFTGRTEIIHGGLFYEAIYLEGSKTGETCWVADRIAALYIN